MHGAEDEHHSEAVFHPLGMSEVIALGVLG